MIILVFWCRVTRTLAAAVSIPMSLPDLPMPMPMPSLLKVCPMAIVVLFPETINTIHTITANTPAIIAADFNVTPHTWHESGHLATINMQTITTHAGRCKHTDGWSQLDYLLVSTSIAPLVRDLRTVADVPWSPHLGIQFSINARPRTAKTLQAPKPLPLPYNKDNSGKRINWHCTDAQWQEALAKARPIAERPMARAQHHHPEIANYTTRLGIGEPSRDITVQYMQWTIAAEAVIHDQCDDIERNRRYHRATMPKLQFKSMATSLSKTPIEYTIWNMPTSDSRLGNGLYTTLWQTRTTMLKHIQSSRCADMRNHILHHPSDHDNHFTRGDRLTTMTLYHKFTRHICTSK